MLKKIGELEEFNFLEEKIKKDKKKRQHVRYDFDWLTLGIEQALSKIHMPYSENGIVITTHQLDVHCKQMGIEVIGTFHVDKYLARLETRSSELAEFARDHFVSVFGQMLTFKRIIKKDMEKVLKKEEKTDQTNPAEEVNPLIQDVAMNELYMGLLDKKVPALNHMTPREARNDPQMLPLVISWLKEIENREEKRKRQGERHYSVDKLKKELNIDF
jgi:hypothetical protein